MEITGKIIQVLAPQSGEGKNGPWTKQEYILETQGQYPKKVCFEVWGDKINKLNIQDQQELSVSIEVESREYNNRWYTNIRAWKISKGVSEAPVNTSITEPVDELKGMNTEGEDDALPF